MPIRTAAAATARRCRFRKVPSYLSDAPKLPISSPRCSAMKMARRGICKDAQKLSVKGPQPDEMQMACRGFCDAPTLFTTGPRAAAMQMPPRGIYHKIFDAPTLSSSGPRPAAMQTARRGICSKIFDAPTLSINGARPAAMQIARRGICSKISNATKISVARSRPAAMHMARRCISDKIPPEVRDEISKLQQQILDVDSKAFTRFKDVSMGNASLAKRLTTLSNQVADSDMKWAQHHAIKIVRNADSYFKNINVAWKVSLSLITVGGAVGYTFLGEVKEGWQDDCSKKNEEKMDKKLAKLKEELAAELKTLLEQEKKPSEGTQ